jgi:uncharacterized protein
MDLNVSFERSDRHGAFFIAGEGGRIAELTFTAATDGKRVSLDHTEVSESLRGRGVARTLVEAAVAWARRENLKLVPVCPFARAVFHREPSFADVLA